MRLFDFLNKLTTNDIKRVENHYEIELPQEYKKHILSLNGNSYSGAYIQHPEYGELDFSRFISLSKKNKRNVYDIYQKNIEGKKFFPFADTDFGDFYCLDIESKQIVLWFHETGKVITVCDSFEIFLGMLKYSN